MRIAFFDCHAGVAGDMWVGALLDAGLPLRALADVVASLGLPGVTVQAKPVLRCGIAGTQFVVDQAIPSPDHRHLDEIVRIVGRAAVPGSVRERALAVFDALATVEAAAHGIPKDHVHFHELGAADTIVDVVGAIFGLHELGVERVHASAVEVGRGVVRCEHGVLPVPAPGALGNLLGVPLTRRFDGERTTPTGAALLRVTCEGFEPELAWTPERSGLGAGSRDDAGLPNLLRVTIGVTADTGSDSVLEIACNLDTLDGESVGWAIATLLELGAVDAWATPITMKKGRPAYTLTALAPDRARDAVVRFLLEESSTLGVRLSRVTRSVLERWSESVATPFGPLRVKCARLPSGAVMRRPESDDVERLCRETGRGRRALLAELVRLLDA